MACAFVGGGVAASKIINFVIVFRFSTGLRFAQLCFDFDFQGAAELVFENFVFVDKSVTCFKLFVGAYRQVHAERLGLLAFSSLVGLSIHSSTIVIYLYMNHRSRARAWISGMAILVAAGAFMLAVKIPEDYAWHNTAVEAILDFFMCLEAVLFVRSKMNEHGGNDNFLRDLIMIAAEFIVNFWLLYDYVVNAHILWDAETILHLFGTCLAMLIVVGQLGWLTYKMYTHGVFDREVGTVAGAAADGGDDEQQRMEEGVEVEERGGKTPPVFTGEVEMAARAADGSSQ